MSRIGKMPIKMPAGVKVSIENNTINVEGPKGKQTLEYSESIKVDYKDNLITLTRMNDLKETKSLHGLYKVMINNMVTGVTTGFLRKLQIIGTGYKSSVEGNKLVLNLGYSMPKHFPIPTGIKITVDNNINLLIEGIDKQLVGQVAANIRRMRPPEPYKGKGVKYLEETIRRKAGKSAKK